MDTAQNLLVHIHDLLDYLYGKFKHGEMEIGPVSFHYSGEVSRGLWGSRDRFFVIPHKNQLRYLRGKYKPQHISQGRVEFNSGCLSGVGPGFVQFRDKSEWFRKIWTDLTFAAEWSGASDVEVHIPRLWIRQIELPLMAAWFGWSNLHPTHLEIANKVLMRYPLDQVLAIKYKSVQKSMLAYYVQTEDLSVDDFWKARRAR